MYKCVHEIKRIINVSNTNKQHLYTLQKIRPNQHISTISWFGLTKCGFIKLEN